jgi:hypothetical protein
VIVAAGPRHAGDAVSPAAGMVDFQELGPDCLDKLLLPRLTTSLVKRAQGRNQITEIGGGRTLSAVSFQRSAFSGQLPNEHRKHATGSDQNNRSDANMLTQLPRSFVRLSRFWAAFTTIAFISPLFSMTVFSMDENSD